MLKSYITLMLFLLIFKGLLAQTHIVFLDDSLYYFKPHTKTYYQQYNVAFKDSLEDGLWIMHNLYKKDSCLASDSTIILKGNYKNNIKHGVFYTYEYDRKFLKIKGRKFINDINYIAIAEMYENGLLNGLCIYPERTTMYKNGHKNGMENITSKIFHEMETNIYSNDTLVQWYEYIFNFLMQVGERIGDQEYKIITFNIDGIKEYELYYKDEDLYKYYKFFPNGQIKTEAVGVFAYTKRIQLEKSSLGIQKWGGHPSKLHFYSDYVLEIINGSEKIYDEQGMIIKENKYIDGKVVE